MPVSSSFTFSTTFMCRTTKPPAPQIDYPRNFQYRYGMTMREVSWWHLISRVARASFQRENVKNLHFGFPDVLNGGVQRT